jgi:hypothetical protein
MRYLQSTFTLPAGPGNVSQLEWDIATGKRCPVCLELMPNHGGGCEPDLRPDSIRKIDADECLLDEIGMLTVYPERDDNLPPGANERSLGTR